jgi:hypothetical protein
MFAKTAMLAINRDFTICDALLRYLVMTVCVCGHRQKRSQTTTYDKSATIHHCLPFNPNLGDV